MKIFNTMTRKKEDFIPMADGHASVYSCGPTVYDYAHIGNMRTYIFMDILGRVLRYNGYKTKHVMNITDVGHLVSDEDEGVDKIVLTAEKEKKTPVEIAEYYTKVFFDDVEKLNIQAPDIITKATDNIPEMIDFVKGLFDKGYAYETSDGIYFDIKKFSHYGRLSRLDFDNQIAGARVTVNTEKKHPSDFALWKKAGPNHIMQWDSPWGRGFPGWHIECSAMSRKYLGDTFDIHTGGVDHIPIHHENEIAQTEAYTGKPMAGYWMHAEFLLIDNGKMSKSLKNIYTVSTLEEKGYRAMDYRFFCLNANYGKKLNFTWDGLESSSKAYNRFLEGILEHKYGKDGVDGVLLKETMKEFDDAVNDDLNVPLALAAAWKLVRNESKSHEIYDVLLKMDKIFGLRMCDAEMLLSSRVVSDISDEIIKLSEKRIQAKKSKDFDLADKIRAMINEMGYEIKDTRDGPVISKKRDGGS